MAAGRIIIEAAQPSLDANSRLINGATLTFLNVDTLAPAPVFSDSTLATSLGNVVTASGGFFPDMWAADGAAFRVEWRNAAGSLLRTFPRIEAAAANAPTTAYSATLLAVDDASEARDVLGVPDYVTDRLGGVRPKPNPEDRMTFWNTAWANLLPLVPTVLGAGQPAMLVDSLGRPALNETYLRQHVQTLANDLGIKRIVLGQLEFGGYHWLRAPTGQSWPESLDQVGLTPGWYWEVYAGDKTSYQNVDVIDIIMDEARRQGIGVVIGLSRDGDVNLLNDDANCRIGMRFPSSLDIPSGTGSKTVTASSATFLAGWVGRNIVLDSGAGSGVITGFTSANQITVNVTTEFSNLTPAAGTWRLRQADPLYRTLTVAQRVARAVNATRQQISWCEARWGTSPALLGYYSAHEPDNIEAMGGTGAYFTGVWTGSGTYAALNTYRGVDGIPREWWAAPASPVDLYSALPTDAAAVARMRAALVASGCSHVVDQDGVGPGTNRLTGAYGNGVVPWTDYIPTTLTQLFPAAQRWRQIMAGTFLQWGWHSELWQMDGPDYTNAYPAPGSRLMDQWANEADLAQFLTIYQTVGVIAKSTDAARPPVSAVGKADYRQRAEDLTAALIARHEVSKRSPSVQGSAVASNTSGQQNWTVLGGTFDTSLPTYQPSVRASVAHVEVTASVTRTGAAGAATGFLDMALKINGTLLTATNARVLADDDRAGAVTLRATVQTKGQPVTIAVTVDNQLIAPTVARVDASWRVLETVG